MSDISVSRSHALLTYSAGKVWLRDNESKFGTLVLLQRKLRLPPTSMFQCGRSVLNVAHCTYRTAPSMYEPRVTEITGQHLALPLASQEEVQVGPESAAQVERKARVYVAVVAD